MQTELESCVSLQIMQVTEITITITDSCVIISTDIMCSLIIL